MKRLALAAFLIAAVAGWPAGAQQAAAQDKAFPPGTTPE